jgi:Mechanosensitive ion channel
MPGPGRIAAVDLQEKRQHELTLQMARVRKRARPWRSIIAAVLAVLAGVTSYQARHDPTIAKAWGHVTADIVTQCAAAAFCILAVIAIVGLAGKAREVLQPGIGEAHAAVVRYAILLAGGTAVLLLTLDLSGVPVGQLALGGAVTGILLGIAGQQSLANIFAGLVLLLSRPFVVGDPIVLRSGAMGGLIEGTVTEIGITYLRLDTADGVLHLPNAQVLAAAVGPRATPRPGGTAASLPVSSANSAQAGTADSRPPGTAGGLVTPAVSGPAADTAAPPFGGAGNAGPLSGSTGPPDGGQPPGVP